MSIRLSKIVGLLLIVCCSDAFCNSYEESQKETYRNQRFMQERDYVRSLEEGEEVRKPYKNEAFDRANGYNGIID